MDATTKRRQAARARRQFSRLICAHGFCRTKPTFWTREHQHFVHFIHLHLFSFAPAFRVHLGVRVLNDDFPAAALNGPCSPDGWFTSGRGWFACGPRRYDLSYSETDESVRVCAENLAAYIKRFAIPWFERFSDVQTLLHDRHSPLTAEAKQALWRALDGHVSDAAVRRSRSLLGIS